MSENISKEQKLPVVTPGKIPWRLLVVLLAATIVGGVVFVVFGGSTATHSISTGSGINLRQSLAGNVSKEVTPAVTQVGTGTPSSTANQGQEPGAVKYTEWQPLVPGENTDIDIGITTIRIFFGSQGYDTAELINNKLAQEGKGLKIKLRFQDKSNKIFETTEVHLGKPIYASNLPDWTEFASNKDARELHWQLQIKIIDENLNSPPPKKISI